MGVEEGDSSGLQNRSPPVGVFEIGPEGTRFVSVTDRKKLAGVLATGWQLVCGLGGDGAAEVFRFPG